MSDRASRSLAAMASAVGRRTFQTSFIAFSYSALRAFDERELRITIFPLCLVVGQFGCTPPSMVDQTAESVPGSSTRGLK